MRAKTAILLAALSLIAGPILAQQAAGKQLSAEDPRKPTAATASQMASSVSETTAAVLDVQIRVAARPETAEAIAAFKKNLYEALLKQGFNGQDAIAITLATPPPSAPLNSR